MLFSLCVVVIITGVRKEGVSASLSVSDRSTCTLHDVHFDLRVDASRTADASRQWHWQCAAVEPVFIYSKHT